MTEAEIIAGWPAYFEPDLVAVQKLTRMGRRQTERRTSNIELSTLNGQNCGCEEAEKNLHHRSVGVCGGGAGCGLVAGGEGAGVSGEEVE